MNPARAVPGNLSPESREPIGKEGAMAYSELMVAPMRRDLTRLGIRELRTAEEVDAFMEEAREGTAIDRKSTRLNSSHVKISYAVFCLKKKILHKESINHHNLHLFSV